MQLTKLSFHQLYRNNYHHTYTGYFLRHFMRFHHNYQLCLIKCSNTDCYYASDWITAVRSYTTLRDFMHTAKVPRDGNIVEFILTLRRFFVSKGKYNCLIYIFQHLFSYAPINNPQKLNQRI